MKKHYLSLAFLFFILIFLDLFTKHLSYTSFGGEGTVATSKQVIKYFTLTYSENTGIAFGLPVPMILLIVLSIALLIGIIYFLKKELNFNKPLTLYLLVLLLAGGAANLYERAYKGYVIDFISIWKWPIFNLADIYISLGILLIIIFYGRIKRV